MNLISLVKFVPFLVLALYASADVPGMKIVHNGIEKDPSSANLKPGDRVKIRVSPDPFQRKSSKSKITYLSGKNLTSSWNSNASLAVEISPRDQEKGYATFLVQNKHIGQYGSLVETERLLNLSMLKDTDPAKIQAIDLYLGKKKVKNDGYVKVGDVVKIQLRVLPPKNDEAFANVSILHSRREVKSFGRKQKNGKTSVFNFVVKVKKGDLDHNNAIKLVFYVGDTDGIGVIGGRNDEKKEIKLYVAQEDDKFRARITSVRYFKKEREVFPDKDQLKLGDLIRIQAKIHDPKNLPTETLFQEVKDWRRTKQPFFRKDPSHTYVVTPKNLKEGELFLQVVTKNNNGKSFRVKEFDDWASAKFKVVESNDHFPVNVKGIVGKFKVRERKGPSRASKRGSGIGR